MLLLAATKIRQMKMADPSIPTAQTRGSARWVFDRHHLVAPAPVITPRKPVKHVIAPKIKLLKKIKKKKRKEKKKGNKRKMGGGGGVFGVFPQNGHSLWTNY